MKKLFPLLAFILVGAGCYPAAAPAPEPSPTLTPPPAITMTADGKAVAGVEGSYCYGTTCVDKIAPPELVKESGLGFTTVSRGAATFTSSANMSSVSVNVQGVTGASIDSASADLKKDASGGFAYKVPASLPAGDYYLIASAQFESGGDGSFIFPIHLK